MGNGSSKTPPGPSLTKEERECIKALLGGVQSDKESVSMETLQVVWRDMITESLQKTFFNYLFRKSKTKAISILEFELFFYKMTDANLEERAETVLSLLGIVGNNIPPKHFQTYVSDLIESYMLILNNKYPDVYSSWKSGDLTQKADIEAISYFCIKDINYSDDGRVALEELERWLRNSSFLKEITESVIKVCFGMDIEELRPILPTANKVSTLLRIPTVLALSHFSRQTSKTWRLLYSSSDEAHSWQIFQNRLFHEGPTLVLVQDRGGPLIGGYASKSWKINPTFYGDENCFLFRLRPELRLCLPTGYNQNFQYMNSGATTLPNGLGMGGQLNYFGFFLSAEFGPGSVSKTCTTFRDYVPLASQQEFTFSQLEVWAIGERDPIEEGVRQTGPGGLIMQRDLEAMALMEMAGKVGHAKAAGELPEEDS